MNNFPELPEHFNGFRNVVVDTLSEFLTADRVADYCVQLYDESSRSFKLLKDFWDEIHLEPEATSWVEIDRDLFHMVEHLAHENKDPIFYTNFAYRFDEVLFS